MARILSGSRALTFLATAIIRGEHGDPPRPARCRRPYPGCVPWVWLFWRELWFAVGWCCRGAGEVSSRWLAPWVNDGVGAVAVAGARAGITRRLLILGSREGNWPVPGSNVVPALLPGPVSGRDVVPALSL